MLRKKHTRPNVINVLYLLMYYIPYLSCVRNIHMKGCVCETQSFDNFYSPMSMRTGSNDSYV